MREDDDMSETGNQKQDEPPALRNSTPKLTLIVERLRAINADVKALKMEAKELEDSALDECGYSAKAVRTLAKEAAWNEVEREARRQLEDEIDKGRAALGLLAQLPLWQAELERMATQKLEEGTAAPRRRGRPKGSKNKPKTESVPYPLG